MAVAAPVPAAFAPRVLRHDAAALTGFGHPAVITVGAVLVISEALQASRAADLLGEAVQRLPLPPRRRLAVLLAAVTGPRAS